MAGVVGIVGDTIAIYQFISSLFGGGSSSRCNVRIGAALNGGSLSGAEGSINTIKIHNQNENLLGSSGSGWVGSGSFKDFGIDQVSNQQAVYATIYASNDAICIPYITSTWSDGSTMGWVGDWGYQCGLDWYYSNVYVDNGQNKPRCTWIDGDHTNNLKAGTLSIHFPSFSSKSPWSKDKYAYCGYPEFRAWRTNNAGEQIFKKRGEGKTRRTVKVDSRLVISSEPTHNIVELCESETSHGPDFVSTVEGLYCNMETRQLLPLCSADITTDCFQLPDNSTTAKVKRDGVDAEKTFSAVIDWN